VFTRPAKPTRFENSSFAKPGRNGLVLNDAMFHADVVWRAARVITMASPVVDAATGGWQ